MSGRVQNEWVKTPGNERQVVRQCMNGDVHTLVLLVEGAVSTPPAEGVALGVPLTMGGDFFLVSIQ